MKGMKLHLMANNANGKHTTFTVFMNGCNCGQLCMTEKEAAFFHDVILNSKHRIPEDVIYSDGKWFVDKPHRTKRAT